VKLLRSPGLLFGKDRAAARDLTGLYHETRFGGLKKFKRTLLGFFAAYMPHLQTLCMFEKKGGPKAARVVGGAVA
jgi:hypothetical protein